MQLRTSNHAKKIIHDPIKHIPVKGCRVNSCTCFVRVFFYDFAKKNTIVFFTGYGEKIK